MADQFSRTRMVLGPSNFEILKKSRVAVFGIGGVGGHAVEALARSGLGALDLIDSDTVEITNINRQLVATLSTIGRYKVDVMEERIRDIAPDCAVRTYKMFFLPETADTFDFAAYDYVVDAIDTVSGKLGLIAKCREAGVPIICSMGAGNKMDPAAFEVTDIYKTSVDPLAKVIRKKCKEMGIRRLKVVWSREEPLPQIDSGETERDERGALPPGSTAFVPSVAGLILASEVIKDLIHFDRKNRG